ncbi:hypothetical protein BDDG_07145 [Blastomyces dermatitidis ATCC 18188]|uniref:Uncharacterized protein n=1 Tax=Ajellomyces dermatitidis (strain ATCC 18188 / CBS 674.68) TaxID=653446 RepID=F2TLT7_AJEDA|nr:hypothetical protein BDDG_07145 [Blastomyces dermatitidis ATCC 18188]
MPVATATPRKDRLWGHDKRSRRSSPSSSSGTSIIGYSETDSESYEDSMPLLRKPSPSRSKQRAPRISIDTSNLAERDKATSSSLSKGLISPIYKTIYPISAKDVNTCLSPVYKVIYPRTDDKDGNPQSPIYETIYPRHTRRHSLVLKSPIFETGYPREKEPSTPAPASPASPIYVTIRPRSKDCDYSNQDVAEHQATSPMVMFRDGQHKVTCTKGHTIWLPESENTASQRRRQKCCSCEIQEEIKTSCAKYQKPDIQRRCSTSSYGMTGLKRNRDGSLDFVRSIRGLNVPQTTNLLDILHSKPSLYDTAAGRYARLDKPKHRSNFDSVFSSLAIHLNVATLKTKSQARSPVLLRYRTSIFTK